MQLLSRQFLLGEVFASYFYRLPAIVVDPVDVLALRYRLAVVLLSVRGFAKLQVIRH